MDVSKYKDFMKGSVLPKKQFTINTGEKVGVDLVEVDGKSNLFSYENMRAEALKELNKGKDWDDEFKELNDAVDQSQNGEQWL